jgi:protein-tyrosine phosphatase
MSFDFVTRRLATGGEIKTPKEAACLIAAGVTHVLNVADNANCDMILAYVLNKPANVTCLRNPIDDNEPRQPKPVSWFETSLRFILPALAEPRTKVYVHCKEGLNRGPVTAYCALRALGFSPLYVEGLIRQIRPQVELHYMQDAEAALVALGYT